MAQIHEVYWMLAPKVYTVFTVIWSNTFKILVLLIDGRWCCCTSLNYGHVSTCRQPYFRKKLPAQHRKVTVNLTDYWCHTY